MTYTESFGAFELDEADSIEQDARLYRRHAEGDRRGVVLNHAAATVYLSTLARQSGSWATLKLAMVALDLAEGEFNGIVKPVA